MRLLAAFGLAFALAAPGVVQGPAASGSDEAAIRRVIQQHDQARTKGDWKGVAHLYTEDGATLTSAGEWRRGRPQIEKGGAAAAAGVYKGGKFTTTIDRVRGLAPTVVIADGTFEISGIAGGSRKGNITYVLVKSGDAWRIAETRSMVPTTAGPTPPR